MESDVSATLSDLERKLKELERELEAVGRGGEADIDPAQGAWAEPAAAPPRPEQPSPPAPGTEPFTASWHGTQGVPSAAAPPPPLWDGAPAPVPVPPPPAPWQAAAPPPPASWPAAPPQPPAPAAGLHRQLDELMAFRERLVHSTNELIAELSRVLSAFGAQESALAAPATPPPPPDPAATVLAGQVVVEAGPFADVATLAAFEQALSDTYAVADVHVRSLDAGHATIEVHLAEPVALAAELRRVASVAFSVADVREGWLALAVVPSAGVPPA